MKILLTGIAGTGKSTIINALNERGITAIDLHDVPGLCFWQDIATKKKVEYKPAEMQNELDRIDFLCDLDKLKELLSRYDDLVVALTAGGNQNDYLPLFDKIILLQSDPETLVHRMKTRDNKSGFGKTNVEQEDNIKWQKEFDPELLSRGAIPVDTGGSLDDVVDKIISLIK